METLAEISKVMSHFFQLMAEEKWEEIDRELAEADTTMMTSQMLVVYARSTYTARTKLLNWNIFVLEAFNVISNRGLDAGNILKGLM